MLKASQNYQKSENKNETFKGCCESKFDLQITVNIADNIKKNEVLYQKSFTSKGLIHITVRPLLTGNSSIYCGHHVDYGFENNQTILTGKARWWTKETSQNTMRDGCSFLSTQNQSATKGYPKMREKYIWSTQS